jgi:hypothetical protein
MTSASSETLSSRWSIIVWLRSAWPASAPGVPLATIRWKCNDTPAGASAVISGSTVGLPGGTRNPSRARQPFVILFS